MERLIELYIDTNTLEFYNREGSLGAYTPAISAGELVRLTFQLCDGPPAFDSDGKVTNPDIRFAGTLAAGESVIDNNFNWYDPVTLAASVTSGSPIGTLRVKSTVEMRPLGTIVLGKSDTVNYCEAVKQDDVWLLTLADANFSPADFTPSANYDSGAAARNIERPVIVSAQNDSSGRDTGLFTGLLDAANPVYESLIEGKQSISGTKIELNVYLDGRSVFRARFDFDCTGSIAMNPSAEYIHSNIWAEADSRYIRREDWALPDEYQYSTDNAAWHDEQTAEDRYIRIRRPGGDWGPGIELKAGPRGNGLAFDASGPVSERAQYDAEAKGFVFFATDEGNFYVKNSATSADWSAAIPLRGATGPAVIADPVTEMAVADETWGDCRYLDAAFRQLSFRGRVRSLRRVSLETVSIDSGVTGNIVLVPIVNGSELSGTSFVVAVGAEPAVTTFELEVASGTLALRRDTDDERDTLKDSGNTPVTAVVLSVILEVQYDA